MQEARVSVAAKVQTQAESIAKQGLEISALRKQVGGAPSGSAPSHADALDGLQVNDEREAAVQREQSLVETAAKLRAEGKRAVSAVHLGRRPCFEPSPIAFFCCS